MDFTGFLSPLELELFRLIGFPRPTLWYHSGIYTSHDYEIPELYIPGS